MGEIASRPYYPHKSTAVDVFDPLRSMRHIRRVILCYDADGTINMDAVVYDKFIVIVLIMMTMITSRFIITVVIFIR